MQEKSSEKFGDGFGLRLRQIRTNLGLSGESLAEKLGVTKGTISNWENGTNSPSPANLKSLSDALGVSVRYLTGQAASYVLNEAPPSRFRRIPVVSWARAGAVDESGNYGDLANQIDEWLEAECQDVNSFAVIVEGDSMEPDFHAGDRVIILPNQEARNNDFVLCRLRDTGGVMFKRYRRTGPEGRVIRLESVNQNYQPVMHPIEAFRFIYPALQLQRWLRRCPQNCLTSTPTAFALSPSLFALRPSRLAPSSPPRDNAPV